VSKFWRLEVQGCRGRGRPKKTWEQSVKCDIRKTVCRAWSGLIGTSGEVVMGQTVQPLQAWKKDVINCLIDFNLMSCIYMSLVYCRMFVLLNSSI